MYTTSPSSGGIPPDLSQNKPTINVHNPQLVSSSISLPPVTNLHSNTRTTVAQQHIVSSKIPMVKYKSNIEIPSCGKCSPAHVITLHKNSEHSTVRVIFREVLQIFGENQLVGKDATVIQLSQDQYKLTPTAERIANNFQNQHFIEPNSTTFQNGDSFELRSQASRQNVKANSTALLGVQTNPHVAQGNQDVTHHVTFQELAQNCGDQILPKNAFSQVVDVQASHPSHIQTQSTTLPMTCTYPKISTNFDKPKHPQTFKLSATSNQNVQLHINKLVAPLNPKDINNHQAIQAAMTFLASDQQPFTAGHPPPTISPITMTTNNNFKPQDYSNILKPAVINNPVIANSNLRPTIEPIPVRRATFLNGQPLVKFTEAEVERMNVIEGLQYVVVGKFSYGWPELQELRKIFPAQC